MSQGSEKRNMRALLRLVCLGLLLTHTCRGTQAGETERGCKDWTLFGNTEICCDLCHPGNRIVTPCGLDPKDLCTPCEPDSYTVEPANPSCLSCTQCVGAQILVKPCTISSDTVCGCKPGKKCGDAGCSFCVQECGKGQEPADNRTCRDCPEGTFNDKIHEKCIPWHKSCPDPNAHIESKGDAFNDIKCSTPPENNSTSSITTLESHQKPGGDSTTAFIVVIAVLIAIILTIASAIISKRILKKNKYLPKTYPVSVTAILTTDEPRTLRSEPGEYSYHQPEQEQGSSSESLATSHASKDPLLV